MRRRPFRKISGVWWGPLVGGCGSHSARAGQACASHPTKIAPPSDRWCGDKKNFAAAGGTDAGGGRRQLTFSNFSIVRLSIPPHL